MNKSKSFTLIELLVVIAIIGLISSIVLVRMGDVRAQARDVKRLEAAYQLNLALELYYDKYGEYPHWTGSGSDEGVCIEEGDGKTELESTLVGNGYIQFLPKDPGYNSSRCGFDGETTYPGNTECYCLTYKTNGAAKQKVFAKMEKENKAAESDGGLYGSYYETYSPVAGSNTITYSTSTSSCQPNWQCGSWSECAINTQTRTCPDANGCGTLVGKPAESQSCESVSTSTPATGCAPEGYTGGILGYTHNCTAECGADANCNGWPSVISWGPSYNQFTCDANRNRTASVSYSYCICNENCQSTFIEEYSSCSNGFVDRGEGIGTCLTQCGADSACNFDTSGGSVFKCDANKQENTTGASYCFCDKNCKVHFRQESGCQNGAAVQLGPSIFNYEFLGRPICLTQCSATSTCHGSDPGGYNFKCNQNGTYNASGNYYCSCGNDCQLSISSNFTYTCTDSDGGINYPTNGTVQAQKHYPDGFVEGNIYTDSCLDGTTLKEYFCTADNATTSAQAFYACPKGCSGGACRP